MSGLMNGVSRRWSSTVSRAWRAGATCISCQQQQQQVAHRRTIQCPLIMQPRSDRDHYGPLTVGCVHGRRLAQMSRFLARIPDYFYRATLCWRGECYGPVYVRLFVHHKSVFYQHWLNKNAHDTAWHSTTWATDTCRVENICAVRQITHYMLKTVQDRHI